MPNLKIFSGPNPKTFPKDDLVFEGDTGDKTIDVFLAEKYPDRSFHKVANDTFVSILIEGQTDCYIYGWEKKEDLLPVYPTV